MINIFFVLLLNCMIGAYMYIYVDMVVFIFCGCGYVVELFYEKKNHDYCPNCFQ